MVEIQPHVQPQWHSPEYCPVTVINFAAWFACSVPRALYERLAWDVCGSSTAGNSCPNSMNSLARLTTRSESRLTGEPRLRLPHVVPTHVPRTSVVLRPLALLVAESRF